MNMHDRATALLSIDIGAVVENWRRIVTMVGPKVEVAGVVKADCYGLGAARLAPALHDAGCRRFFVATIEEGIALRSVLAKDDILVLGGPLPGTADDMAHHRLIPVLNSLEQLGQWVGYARATDTVLPAALHLDTGMSRLGLDAPAVARLAADPALLGGIEPVLVVSHMACADTHDHPKNREQLAAFKALSGQLPVRTRRSLGASSTVFLGPDYHFDLVRPGVALYGVNPQPDGPNPMRPVVRLAAKIVQVRDVDTPMTVGYGATHRVTRRGRVAAVAAGYADGVFRSLGNRGFGTIGGYKVPVVGRISMDLTTFDVSDVPADLARPGALIELIGPDHPIEALADEAGTIAYEILTALGHRYMRVYDESGAA